MNDYQPERRQFSRAMVDLPVAVHQGGDTWQQRVLNISLGGIATDQPNVWDAQYNQVFNLEIHLPDGNTLELHAYLQHVEAERLGFSVQHVDRNNIDALRGLLERHLDDPIVLVDEMVALEALYEQGDKPLTNF